MKKMLVSMLLLIIPMIAMSQDDLSQMRFVFGGPYQPGSPDTRHTIRVYKLQESSGELTVLWSLPDTVRIANVNVFAAEGVMCVSQSHVTQGTPTAIVALSEGEQGEMQTVLMDDIAGLAYYGALSREGTISDLLMIQTGSEDTSPELLDMSSGERSACKSAPALADLRISGAGPAGYGMFGNVIYVRIHDGRASIPDGVVEPQSIDVQLDPSLDGDRKWLMFANSDEKSYLYKLWESREDSTTTVLIIDRTQQKFDTVCVPGPRSYVRYFGKWLGGIVRDFHPDYDFTQRFGKHSVARSTAFIVNCSTLDLSIVELGEGATLLWVDDVRIVYRIQNKLYEATHIGGEITETRLLSSEDVVYMLHWAYMAGGE